MKLEWVGCSKVSCANWYEPCSRFPEIITSASWGQSITVVPCDFKCSVHQDMIDDSEAFEFGRGIHCLGSQLKAVRPWASS